MAVIPSSAPLTWHPASPAPKAVCSPVLSLLISLSSSQTTEDGSFFMLRWHGFPFSQEHIMEQELAFMQSPKRWTNLACEHRNQHYVCVSNLRWQMKVKQSQNQFSKSTERQEGRLGTHGYVGHQPWTFSCSAAASAWWLCAFSTSCLKCVFSAPSL